MPQPQDFAVLRAIEHAAKSGLPCPTNQVLCEILQASSWSTPARALKRLEKGGHISVQRGRMTRIVTITATGACTAGEIKAPHWREVEGRSTLARPRRRHTRLGAHYDPPPPSPSPDRTPCFYCGTRADVGCQHRRAA